LAGELSLASWQCTSGLNAVAAADSVVYAPDFMPDLAEARQVFELCAASRVAHVVLVSSTAIYQPSEEHPGMVGESHPLPPEPRNSISRAWAEVEQLAAQACAGSAAILRAAPVLVASGKDPFSRMLRRRVAITLPGHDPSVQSIGPRELGCVVRAVLEKRATGVFNVAPTGTVPLRVALRIAGVRRLPVPRTVLSLVRRGAELDFLRFACTASAGRAAEQFGFEAPPAVEVVQSFVRECGRPVGDCGMEPDPFGMDRQYIGNHGRALFRFLHDVYWRIDERGLANIPRTGAAVMAGVHRGFMPYDGVMTLHTLASRTGRYPRFLIHPCLLKFPFLHDFMTKLGGVIACQENADYFLSRGELVAVFPEGIRGAFTLYRDAYKVGRFGRDEYVRMALRHRVPIIPFVTVGSAEIYPIFARLEWKWWKRWTGWPYLPITATFPLIPLPLPSKWHTLYLEPVHVEREYGPEAAGDPLIVRSISADIRRRMQVAIDDLVRRRRHIFGGRILEPEASQ
jgi:1-acyl-sn-glycerol-3-phosphate acyltransferase/nucleoside-diphosphate-sugar epimerase